MSRRNGHGVECPANGKIENRSLHQPRLDITTGPMNGHSDVSKLYDVRRSKPSKQTSQTYSWLYPPLDSTLLRVMNLFTLATWLMYLISEGTFLVLLRKVEPRTWWLVAAAMAAEFCLQIGEMMISINILIPWISGVTHPGELSNYTLDGDRVPSVDAMIPCCGEPADVVMDTVAAVAAQDYPADRLRIFILDDANDPELAALLKSFSDRRKSLPPITHVARDKKPGVRHFYKGGNLRNGFEMSANLGDAGEYFASVDADMIVEPRWLRTVLPHLIVDENVALASPPQHYYNIPYTDPLCQDSYIFHNILEPLSRFIGATSCCGSGFILRREAGLDIGGLPLVDVGEDIFLASLLHNGGWKIAFVDEELQYGLAPDTYASYIKQRMRWTDGAMLLFRHFSFYVPGLSNVAAMSYAQIIFETMHIHTKLNSIAVVFALPALVYCLWSTPTELAATMKLQKSAVLVSCVFIVRLIVFRINRYLVFGRVGTSSVQAQAANRIWGAPYIAWRTIISSMPGLNTFHFQATGSILAKVNERSPARRQRLPWRILNTDTMLRYAYVCAAIAVVLARAWDHFTVHRHSGRQQVLFPLVGPMLCLLRSAYAVSLPATYMTFPPDMPERSELMEHDSDGLNRPKAKAIRGLKIDNNFNDALFDAAFILAWTCF